MSLGLCFMLLPAVLMESRFRNRSRLCPVVCIWCTQAMLYTEYVRAGFPYEVQISSLNSEAPQLYTRGRYFSTLAVNYYTLL